MANNDLWAAIYDLYELLVEGVNEESAFQRFFVRHPIVFSILGYDAAAPFDQKSPHKLPFDKNRGYRPEPDFLCCDRLKQALTIFELKTPFEQNPTTSRSDGNRRKFRSPVESHLAQTNEYVDTIREREAARQIVCEVLGLNQISSYRIFLLYGLANSDDAPNVARLSANRIPVTEILPYDVLLDHLAQRHTLSSMSTSGPGWSFVFHIMLPERQVAPTTYILDVGSDERDRASIFVENESLVFEVIDTSGTRYRSQQCSFRSKVPIYLRWEFSTSGDGMMIACNIANMDVDFRQGAEPIAVHLNAAKLSMGADLRYNNRARFSMHAGMLYCAKDVEPRRTIGFFSLLQEVDRIWSELRGV